MKNMWKTAIITIVIIYSLFGCGQESERMVALQNKKAELQEEITSGEGGTHVEEPPEDEAQTEEPPEDVMEPEELPEDEAEPEELPEEKAEIDSETEALLYTYYEQYNPLLGDGNSELLQLTPAGYSGIILDRAYMRKDCYEELQNSLVDLQSDDESDAYSVECVHRADQKILSYIIRKLQDNTAIRYVSHTFDVASGRELSLEDMVANMDALRGVIAKKAGKEEVAVSDLEVWTAGYEGITVYLQTDTGKAAPIYISYEQYPDLFDERVNHVPSGYAAGFDQYTDLVLDVDEDGAEDVIQLELELKPGESDTYRRKIANVTVRINKQEISFQPGRYADDYTSGGYFIQNDDGQKYIYVYTKGELDFEWYYDVIRLDREGPVYLGYDEANIGSSQILTDPQRVKIEHECFWGTRGFHMWKPFDGLPSDSSYVCIDSEGYLERDDEVFYCGEIFTATKDVEGIRVNVDGTLTQENVVIAEGENVILFRTEGYDTYSDYILTDGSICRVEMEW